MGRHDLAVSLLTEAVAQDANNAVLYCNLGHALAAEGELDAAIACQLRALELAPGLAEAHNNLGTVFSRQRRLAEAAACFRAALDCGAAKPEVVHYNLAMVLLAQGDFAAGWPEYEWRWHTPHGMRERRDFRQPLWRGEAAAGARLLIHAEQGLGDTLQFCRYAPLAARRGLHVILEVQPPLVRLLGGLPGVAQVVGRGEAPPAFDLACPMLSLPLALGGAIPAAIAYLRADPLQAQAWGRRLADVRKRPERGPRVGLAWAGNPLAVEDARRSLPSALLAPLFDVAGAHFFSLQKDHQTTLPLADHMAEMADFADTAALVANLDLVIAVDTAVAHLAAALGRPVWLLNRYDSCWRWFVGRRDSPWYPTLQIYRQPAPGDWQSVIADVARNLARWIGGR